MGKSILYMISIYLTAPITESFWPEFGEKISLLGALAFFLYYFMKELKETRQQADIIRKLYEEKMEKMYDRIAELEKNSNASINKLADAVDSLAENIKNRKL